MGNFHSLYCAYNTLSCIMKIRINGNENGHKAVERKRSIYEKINFREILFGMMSDERCMKKINVKVTFFLSLIAVVLLTAGILCGREVWLYEHPEIRITFSCDKRENIYRSYPFCVIRGRSHIGQGYAVRYDEEI